jgi:hypothetical protein
MEVGHCSCVPKNPSAPSMADSTYSQSQWQNLCGLLYDLGKLCIPIHLVLHCWSYCLDGHQYSWTIVFAALHRQLLVYWTRAGVVPYSGYGYLCLHSQVQLLVLLDKLGVPHKLLKWILRECTPVIGFDVHTQAMPISMAQNVCQELANTIKAFILHNGCKHPWHRWQQMLGWANWALNPMPHALQKPDLLGSTQ